MIDDFSPDDDLPELEDAPDVEPSDEPASHDAADQTYAIDVAPEPEP